jgi:hypothetical protein
MISELGATLAELGERVSLVVVDEAHHAAAPSYAPIFGDRPMRGLFLTATPNRADSLPIGIDEIAFNITYRELFARGVIVEPIFDEPITIDDLDWSKASALVDLADYLLERTETDIRKIMVAVSRTDQAEILYDAVLHALERRRTHVLSADDLVFVHGTATSTGASATDLLDEFGAHPRGILIATSQLIGEGFDDPAIDGVVVTYPSTSIGHLMQVAGRAIRSAPGKSQAHVIQVHASRLAYHFEQRWLYQDISDALRPHVVDLVYRDAGDLQRLVEGLLHEHHVDGAVRARIVSSLTSVSIGERYSLLLTGLPYFNDVADFVRDARWGAVLVGPNERGQFLDVFNTFADRVDEVNDHSAFLAKYHRLDGTRGSEWKSFMDMLAAMDYARQEIDRSPYEGELSREYVPRRGTSWIKYVSFEYRPVVPPELDEFLGDAVNRDEVVREFLANPEGFACAVKIPLPLAGTLAFLFDGGAAAWFNEQRLALTQRVASVTPRRSLAEIDEWRYELANLPIPQVVLAHIDRLLSDSAYAQFVLPLGTASSRSDCDLPLPTHASKVMGEGSH